MGPQLQEPQKLASQKLASQAWLLLPSGHQHLVPPELDSLSELLLLESLEHCLPESQGQHLLALQPLPEQYHLPPAALQNPSSLRPRPASCTIALYSRCNTLLLLHRSELSLPAQRPCIPAQDKPTWPSVAGGTLENPVHPCEETSDGFQRTVCRLQHRTGPELRS